MQVYDANLLSYLSTLITIPAELIIFYFVLGKNYKNIEYKVLLGNVLTTAIYIRALTWSLGTMGGSAIGSLISAPFMLVIPLLILYYMVKEVRTNRLKLVNIIDKRKEI